MSGEVAAEPAVEAAAAPDLGAEHLAAEELPPEEPAAEEAEVAALPLGDEAPEAGGVAASGTDDSELELALGEPVTYDDVRVSFAGVEVALPDTNPVLILQEADPPYRELRMPIGTAEGVAIAYAWRRIDTPKPLTHELFADVMRSFGLTLEVVRITGVRGASFSAEIVVGGRPGQRVVPCRPSDGVALALRQRIPVPIVAARAVMEEAARR